MSKIICPKCHTEFDISETDYNTIIKQFKCEIKECLLWYVIQKIDFQKESQKTKKSSKKKEESVA